MEKENQLRYKVLLMALSIEEFLNLMLIDNLEIWKKNSKTLSNRSSNISFQTKLDFLFDQFILSDKEYDMFRMFGQIRNQFIHNYKCSTLTYLFTETETKQIKNKILEYNPKYEQLSKKEKEEFKPDEESYLVAFTYFKDKLQLLLKQVQINVVRDKRRWQLEANRKYITKYHSNVSERFVEKLENVMPELFNHPNTDKEDIKDAMGTALYSALLEEFVEQRKKIENDEEF